MFHHQATMWMEANAELMSRWYMNENTDSVLYYYVLTFEFIS